MVLQANHQRFSPVQTATERPVAPRRFTDQFAEVMKFGPTFKRPHSSDEKIASNFIVPPAAICNVGQTNNFSRKFKSTSLPNDKAIANEPLMCHLPEPAGGGPTGEFWVTFGAYFITKVLPQVSRKQNTSHRDAGSGTKMAI